MIHTKEDLTNKIFGKLKVIKQLEDYIGKNGKHTDLWECICECGKTTKVRGYALKGNKILSCGCSRIKQNNNYTLFNNYGIGYSNNTNECFYFDIEDYDKIKKYHWNVFLGKNNYKYLKAWINGKYESMAQFLLGDRYDHINLNSLDNRKSNLRKATCSQNSMNHPIYKNNTSGYTGVQWNKKDKRWIARITINHQKIHLGHFINKEDAIKARLKAELKYFGDFAPQKNLFEQYNIS